jgi:hypothetical protein
MKYSNKKRELKVKKGMPINLTNVIDLNLYMDIVLLAVIILLKILKYLYMKLFLSFLSALATSILAAIYIFFGLKRKEDNGPKTDEERAAIRAGRLKEISSKKDEDPSAGIPPEERISGEGPSNPPMRNQWVGGWIFKYGMGELWKGIPELENFVQDLLIFIQNAWPTVSEESIKPGPFWVISEKRFYEAYCLEVGQETRFSKAIVRWMIFSLTSYANFELRVTNFDGEVMYCFVLLDVVTFDPIASPVNLPPDNDKD